MSDDDKRLWVCPNCGSTSWEPSGTAEINCHCQYYPPIWTQMVRVEVKARPAPSGDDVGELVEACAALVTKVNECEDVGFEMFYCALRGRVPWFERIEIALEKVRRSQPGPSVPEDVRHE